SRNLPDARLVEVDAGVPDLHGVVGARERPGARVRGAAQGCHHAHTPHHQESSHGTASLLGLRTPGYRSSTTLRGHLVARAGARGARPASAGSWTLSRPPHRAASAYRPWLQPWLLAR